MLGYLRFVCSLCVCNGGRQTVGVWRDNEISVQLLVIDDRGIFHTQKIHDLSLDGELFLVALVTESMSTSLIDVHPEGSAR